MKIDFSNLEVWFITGSQHLYGDKVLAEVDTHSRQIVNELNNVGSLPIQLKFTPVVKSPEEILDVCQQASIAKNCIGVIALMHTFSPAKMWIGGLKVLTKPLLHFHTQFNRDIPWNEIDMDFMNLNQSAHGDREFGYIMSRMRLRRKVVAGHWKDTDVHKQLGAWTRAAAGWSDWQGAKYCRIGDNMRSVAVTDGDKVEAEIKLGYSVNGYGVGDLVSVVEGVSEGEIDQLVDEYSDRYELQKELRKGAARHAELRKAARIEAGLTHFLEKGGFKGFTDTFEDLHGLDQLPGIAVQRLMSKGFGFAAEGDWKTAALVRAMKVMGHGLKGGNSFMEDYTYHLNPRQQLVLGSHMLEICETITNEKPKCEIHPLSIGGKSDPVRLVFNATSGPALNASMIDMGNRFRLLINKVEAFAPPKDLPKLPVARAFWRPLPDMTTGCAAWIYGGGAHHTCYSQNLGIEHLADFAEMAGIELITIDETTSLTNLKKELLWNDKYYA